MRYESRYISRAGQRCGFTLIELLVVISVIALLLSILMPVLQKARLMAKETVCMSNMHQLGLAMHLYESANYRLPEHFVERRAELGQSLWGFPEQLSNNAGIDMRKMWQAYISDLNFLNCPLLKPLDISLDEIPLGSRRIYCGYAFVSGYWRNRNVNGKWQGENGRWIKSENRWMYRGQEIEVLAADRMYYSMPHAYYRLNHGKRLGIPMNYMDYEGSADFCHSVYSIQGLRQRGLLEKTNACYLFKDGSAGKYAGNDEAMVEVFTPSDQDGNRGSYLMPVR